MNSEAPPIRPLLAEQRHDDKSKPLETNPQSTSHTAAMALPFQNGGR
jgi:hypothetical protein